MSDSLSDTELLDLLESGKVDFHHIVKMKSGRWVYCMKPFHIRVWREEKSLRDCIRKLAELNKST